MKGAYKLKGQLQHYTWGGRDYIPQLLNIKSESDKQHYAEYWLGSHPSALSTININGKILPLTQFIADNPTVLGQQSQALFGNELPYLLKILDVAKPLSIQLHPTKQQAEIGFLAENKLGIPLTDPKRTYKDKNHKPEMMIALSDFWLLHGFKQKTAILANLNARPSLSELATKLANQSLQDFYADIMQANQTQLANWLNPIISENQIAYQNNQLSLNNPDYWVLYSMEAMDISMDKLDAGLICFYLFNIVHLKQGEGIYQAAGIPHAYLRGQNIELMSCSDNVIRGGLTPKHIDIAELLKVIECQEIDPKIIPAAPKVPDFTYQTPAPDFALQRISFEKNSTLKVQNPSASILLIMQGELAITQANKQMKLKQGEAIFVCANTLIEISGIETGYAVIAKLP